MDTPQSQIEEAAAEKGQRNERSESEIDIEGGGEASAFTKCQSRCMKEHLTNI